MTLLQTKQSLLGKERNQITSNGVQNSVGVGLKTTIPMKIKILLVFLSISLSGCVSSKKYAEAQTEIARCKASQQDEKENYERQLHQKEEEITELLQYIKELKEASKKLDEN